MRKTLLALLLLSLAPASWGALIYDVSTDLSGLSAGSYLASFQFTDGDGVVNNTVELSNFNFVNANAGSPGLFGAASGSIATGFTLTDGDTLGDPFTGVDIPITVAASAMLSFRITATDNSAGFPDLLQFFILDANGGSLVYVRSDGDQSLLSLNLTGNPNSPAVPQTFPADPAYGGDATQPVAVDASGVSSVPEPSAVMLMASGVAALVVKRLRR